MDRDLLSHLPIVVSVAKRGGFAAAAAELNTSPSNVSHAVRSVEKRLGVPLFARTTRSVALTETGKAFVQAASDAIKDVDSAWEIAQSQTGAPSGLLRINTPRIAYQWFLSQVVQQMQINFPQVTVEYFFDDGLTDAVAEGFDAGIRLGHMIAADMVAVPITGPFRVITVAAPDYLTRCGTPKKLSDLGGHRCIQYRMTSAGNVYQWEYRDRNKDITIETAGGIVVNDMLIALDLARSGHGICYTFESLAQDNLNSGELVEVLPNAARTQPGFYCYYPSRHSESPKLRAFVDTAKSILA